jgi:hypothetical protein
VNGKNLNSLIFFGLTTSSMYSCLANFLIFGDFFFLLKTIEFVSQKLKKNSQQCKISDQKEMAASYT